MDPKIIGLYNDYIHGDMPRRTFLKRVAETAGSTAAAAGDILKNNKCGKANLLSRKWEIDWTGAADTIFYRAKREQAGGYEFC